MAKIQLSRSAHKTRNTKRSFVVVNNGLVFERKLVGNELGPETRLPNVFGHYKNFQAAVTDSYHADELKNLRDKYLLIMQKQLVAENPQSKDAIEAMNLENLEEFLKKAENGWATAYNNIVDQIEVGNTGDISKRIREALSPKRSDGPNWQEAAKILDEFIAFRKLDNSQTAKAAMTVLKENGMADLETISGIAKFKTQIRQWEQTGKIPTSKHLNYLLTQPSETTPALVSLFAQGYVDDNLLTTLQSSLVGKQGVKISKGEGSTRFSTIAKAADLKSTGKNFSYEVHNSTAGDELLQTITIKYAPFASTKTYANFSGEFKNVSTTKGLKYMFQNIYGASDQSKFLFYNTFAHAPDSTPTIKSLYNNFRTRIANKFALEMLGGWDEKRFTSILIVNNKAYSILAILLNIIAAAIKGDQTAYSVFSVEFNSNKVKRAKEWYGKDPNEDNNAQKWRRIKQVIRKTDQMNTRGIFNARAFQALNQTYLNNADLHFNI